MKPKIYIASKVKNSEIIRNFRDKHTSDFICTSSWIELDSDSYFVKHEKGKLWDLCLQDIRKSDFLILYSHNFCDDHNGALVEIGSAHALRKEVFEVGTSFRTTLSDNSDVAYTHHGFYKKMEQTTLEDALKHLKRTTDYWGVIDEE